MATMYGRIAAAFLLALFTALPAAHGQGTWNLYNGLNTIFIPYANGPISAGKTATPEVYLEINGGPATPFGMDTGSTGIAVSKQYYTPGPNDVPGSMATITYSSSGQVLHGQYYTTNVEIMSDKNTPVATSSGRL